MKKKYKVQVRTFTKLHSQGGAKVAKPRDAARLARRAKQLSKAFEEPEPRKIKVVLPALVILPKIDKIVLPGDTRMLETEVPISRLNKMSRKQRNKLRAKKIREFQKQREKEKREARTKIVLPRVIKLPRIK